ncbi:hypothetical protein ACLBYG_22230 [Methylobacterium sp. D53M]
MDDIKDLLEASRALSETFRARGLSAPTVHMSQAEFGMLARAAERHMTQHATKLDGIGPHRMMIHGVTYRFDPSEG